MSGTHNVNPVHQNRTYQTAEPGDPGLFYIIEEYVEDVLNDTIQGKITPVQLATIYERLAEGTREALALAESAGAPPKHQNEYRAGRLDLQLTADLAEFHKWKTMAATDLVFYQKTKKNSYLREALESMRDALGVEKEAVITPNLDKLANEGVRFTQAVCQAPMCIPSRNSMMFGLYPNQLGVLRNGRGIPDDKLPAKPLAQLFAEAGYETAGFGKTHWGVRCGTRGFETRFAAEVFEEGAMMMKDLDPDKKQRYLDETIDYGPGEEDPSGYIGETSALHEREDEAAFMLRTENHKLILNFARKQDASEYVKSDVAGGEFYDLTNDPQEWNNLYKNQGIEEIRMKMTELLMAKLSGMSCLTSGR